ncbi:hypothetical protein [Acinetobacter pullicarnis]|uniref:hypothetical protein n=1 Tax=Acinetobacter pullicarnis TaxID=2576829 RepID=UPI00111CEE4C|nr:hypothetical protein [Acinetobacter pullicarnis]
MPNKTSEAINIYQQALAESVHFSFKTINSNIEKGGLRLSDAQALDLPYISARTLLADGLLIPTDYQANAGKTATLFKVVKATLLDEDLTEATPEFQENVAALKPQIKSVFQTAYAAGTEHINVRMRQLLIPLNKQDQINQQYLSISPLSAAGVNYLLNIEVDLLKEQRKTEVKTSKLKNIQTAVFGIGGANPQNVGSLVRAMQRPLVMAAPSLNPQSRLAFQYFYKGFEYNISNAYINPALYLELRQYAADLEQQAQLSHDLGFAAQDIHSKFSNLRSRQKEVSRLEIIVQDVLAQGQNIYQALKSIESNLPSLKTLDRTSFWNHPEVSLLIQGLINPELQNFEDWQILFANDLSLKIVNHQYWNTKINASVDIALDQTSARNFLSRRIQELLK